MNKRNNNHHHHNNNNNTLEMLQMKCILKRETDDISSAIRKIPFNIINIENMYNKIVLNRDVNRDDFSINGWDPDEFDRDSYKISKNKNKKKQSTAFLCVFCENNNEPYYIYRSHTVCDKNGIVICPKLREYKCPICLESGDRAHTLKYCPQKPIFSMDDVKRMDKNAYNKRSSSSSSSSYNKPLMNFNSIKI